MPAIPTFVIRKQEGRESVRPCLKGMYAAGGVGVVVVVGVAGRGSSVGSVFASMHSLVCFLYL